MSRAIRFEVWRDEQLVDTTTLTQDVIKIGRLPSSHLCIDDESVARMHAVLEVQGDNLRLVDLGSAIGSSINGQRVHKSAAVKLGDALDFGAYQIRLTPAPVAVASRPAAVPPAEAFEKVDEPDIAEVMAVYGDTVLDVQHVGKKVDRTMAYGFLALGGAMLLGGVTYVASQTVLQAEAWAAHEVAAADAAATGRPAPAAPGSAWSGFGVALGMLGLVPLGMGLVRMRDRDPSRYTIGEGDAVSFATTTAALPDPAGFPLVSSNDSGDTSVRFTGGMQGHVTVQGHRYSLEQLVESGQAVAQGAAFAFPLPSGARCRLQHGDITFHVNAVKPGKVVAGRGDADKPFWLYNAAALVGLGTLLGLAQLAMPPEGDYALDDAQADNRYVGYIHQPNLEEEEEPDEEEYVDGKEKSEPGKPGKRAPGTEGKMGKPDSKNAQPRRYAMRGPKDAVPTMSRTFSADVDARQQGILGMIQQDSGHFLASPNGGVFAVGTDDEDLWGNMVGTDIGESVGAAGLGLAGTGRGGGGQADGLLGLGAVGLMGSKGSCDGGDCGGMGYSRGGGAGARFKGRGTKKPRPRIGKATVRGALDKDIIRRVVRSHINQVTHCYNQGLVRDPTLKGRVAIQFTIGSTGKVPLSVVSSTTLKDKNVGNCIAKAVKRWKFPKPDGGATVMVTYPFMLNAS
ncbi:MAG: AgmX/PglI C-terminal domain-containing protein [Nannocystaceae bacterium]|nr:AgmX/PglI C-terminal domain-containing protein [bacterium]